MNLDWLTDGRKIPEDVMSYIRVMAVRAVSVLGFSPELIAKVYHFQRACIYRWLKQYERGGLAALESRTPPGALPRITAEMDDWLKEIVLTKTPVDFGYDSRLWTCGILAELLHKEFGIQVAACTIGLHLKRFRLSYQKPEYQDLDRDPQESEFFLNEKFPRIQRLASKMEADIGFEDESGVGLMTRSGRTWGAVGKPPVLQVSMERGGYNVLSIVTPQGNMCYSVQDTSIDSKEYIKFLQSLIDDRKRPLIILADRASFHTSKEVRKFVRAHRSQLRMFFLPRRTPEMNPDEQVWGEIKHHRIGKQPIKTKQDLKQRLLAALASLQQNTHRILTFFHLPATRYAATNIA